MLKKYLFIFQTNEFQAIIAVGETDASEAETYVIFIYGTMAWAAGAGGVQVECVVICQTFLHIFFTFNVPHLTTCAMRK